MTKNKIIEEYLLNPDLSLDELAINSEANVNYTGTVIREYVKKLQFKKPLWCVPSLDLKGVAYLFDDFSERTIILENSREIVNSEDFTNYELVWLKENYNWRCIN